MIRIRRAVLSDIEGVADVARDVWEQDVLPDVCRTQIEDDTSALWVAAHEADGQHPAGTRHPGEIAGFVSAFLTVDASNHRRWEVDLVAVRRERQGQGLGTQLIGQVCRVGESNEVSLTRALIRVGNIASQRAFAKAGFTTDDQVYQLVLWRPTPEETGCHSRSGVKRSGSIYTDGVALLPMDTLMYRGLWIEGLTSVRAEVQRQALTAARSIIEREHRDNAGALIPVKEGARLAPDLRERGTIHGEYYWFTKPGNRT